MKNDIKIIVVILDGIILDTRTTVKQFIRENVNPNYELPNEIFNIYDIANKLEDPLSFIEKFNLAHKWLDVSILPGAKEGLFNLKEQGYKIILLSKMEKHLQNHLEEHLKNNGLEFDALISTGITQLNHKPFVNYFDILQPKMWIYPELTSMKDIPAKATKMIYISHLTQDENNNANVAKYKNIKDFSENINQKNNVCDLDD